LCVALGNLSAQQRRPGKRRRFCPGFAQQAPRLHGIAALDRQRCKFAQIMSRHDARRRCLEARQLAINPERLLPVMLALVDQSQCIEGARPQAGCLADLLEQALCPVEQSGA